MNHSRISILLLLIGLSCLLGYGNSQCCLKFNGADCVACPDNMHLYRGNCIYNLPNCKAYSNGFDCSECVDGYRLEKSVCVIIQKVEPKPQPKPQPPKAQISKPQPPKTQIPKQQPPKQQSKTQQKPLTASPQAKDYKQFTVNLPLDTSGKNQRAQRALVVDQILRSTYTDIRKADIVKVTDRVYPDNSKIVEMIYKVTGPGKAQTLYQGLMVADLDTFIFKEVSFKKIEDKPQNVETVKPGNSVAANTQGNPQTNTQKQSITQQQNNTQQQVNKQQQTTVQNSTSQNLLTDSKPASNTLPTSQPTPTQNTVSPSNPQQIPPSAPAQPPQPSTITVSGGPKDEYSSIKFIEMSDIDALVDINFVVALNQINNKLPELQGLMPTTILAELGYNTSKLPLVHYVITFEAEDKNKIVSLQEVKLKVVTATSEVKIDSVTKKQPNKKAPANSIPNTAKSPDSVIQSLTGQKLSQRSSYTEISSNPAQADIFFLIFLDNLGKGLQKRLTENGKKPGQNQIVYAGRIDSKQTINFWVQTRVTCANGTKSLFKVTGTENKMTYEVKINDIVPLEDAKTTSTTIKSQTKGQTVDNKNNSQKPNAPQEVIKKFQQPKEYISGSTNNVVVTPVTTPVATPIATTVTPSGTTQTKVEQVNPTSPVVPVAVNTNTESKPMNQPSSSVNTQGSVQTTQQSPPKPTITQVQVPQTPVPVPQTPVPAPQPQTSNPGLPSMVNVSLPPKPPVVPVPVPSAQTQPPVLPTPSSVPSAPAKPEAPFSSKTFQDINQTLNQKAGGFDQIDPTTVQKDDNILRSIQTLLAGRPNRENLKLYKAYIKNFGIKAEYKIYLMDMVSKAPKIDIAEGYCTFDLMRKRIFVISFGLLGQ